MATTTRTTLQYLEQVETFFLAQRGRGLMVSPADAQFLGELEVRGVPAEVVCRGIARAFTARHGQALGYADQAPRSLRACQGFIEQEVQAWRTREVGRNRYGEDEAASPRDRTPVSPTAQEAGRRLEGLRAEIERRGRVAEEPARAYYRRAWRHVKDLALRIEREPALAGDLWSALQDLEVRLLADLYAQLPPIEQLMYRRRAEAQVRLDARAASPKAVAEAVRAALHDELRGALALLPLTSAAP